MEDCLMVLTTAEKREEAETIASHLVENRLAACAQVVGPISSTYWWEGKVDKAEEFMILIKTSRRLYNELETAIKSVHSYTVPEILAVSVTAGNPDYLSWLARELRAEKQD